MEYINFVKIKLYENKNDLEKDNWAIYLEIIDSEFATIKIRKEKYINQICKNIEYITELLNTTA